ncbi:hypothetical protein FQN53_006041 [Emmonsiellopsis sp. PD_33]|nr:hypothetical protein FQN53_006041 [Emmonsiellopsis sp. PD_33]
MTRSFEQIEQVSGYVANTSGNLAATLETLEKIQEQQRLIHGRLRANRVERTSLELDQDYLDFQIQVIRHLHAFLLRQRSPLESFQGYLGVLDGNHSGYFGSVCGLALGSFRVAQDKKVA